MTCPRECEQKADRTIKTIDEVKDTLYGRGNAGGIVHCLNKFITKKGFAVWMAIIIGVSGSFILYGMGSFAQQKEKLNSTASELKVHEEKVSSIQKSLDILETRQQRVIENQTILLEQSRHNKNEIVEAIKAAIKEAGK